MRPFRRDGTATAIGASLNISRKWEAITGAGPGAGEGMEAAHGTLPAAALPNLERGRGELFDGLYSGLGMVHLAGMSRRLREE